MHVIAFVTYIHRFNELCPPYRIVLTLQGETVVQDSPDIVAELINNSERLGSEVAAVSTGKPNPRVNMLCVWV